MPFSNLFVSDIEASRDRRRKLEERIYARAGTAPKPKDWFASLGNIAVSGLAGLFTGGTGGALVAAGSQGLKEISSEQSTFNPLHSVVQGSSTGSAVKMLTAPQYDYTKQYDALPTPTAQTDAQGNVLQGMPIRPKEAYLAEVQDVDPQETSLFLQGVASDKMPEVLGAISESRGRKKQAQLEAIKTAHEMDFKIIDQAYKKAGATLQPVQAVLSSGKSFVAEPSKKDVQDYKITAAKEIKETIKVAKEDAKAQAKATLKNVTVDLPDGSKYTAYADQAEITRLRQSAQRLAKLLSTNSNDKAITANKLMELAQGLVENGYTDENGNFQRPGFDEALDLTFMTLKEKTPELLPPSLKKRGGNNPPPPKNKDRLGIR